MAKPRQNETISDVSDILGFIWEQSEKEPEKRRPVKPKTADSQATSDYVSALVDALALPGTFVGDQYLQTMQGLVDPTIKIGTYRDRIGTQKLKLSEIPDFLENPDDFVDKLFQKNKNIAKMSKIQWAGGQMRMLQGSAYAKKRELFEGYDKEVKGLLERGLGQAAIEGEIGDSVWRQQSAEYLRENGAIAEKILRLEADAKNSISSKKRAEINKELDLLGGSKRVAMYEDQLGELRKRYQNNASPELQAKIQGLERKIGGLNGNNISINGYRYLLSQEFSFRGSKTKDPEEKLRMQEAGNVLGLWSEYEGKNFLSLKDASKIREIRKQYREKTESLVESIKGIKSSNLPDSEKTNQLSILKRQLKDRKLENRQLARIEFWSTAGEVEGLYYGLKNTLGPGGFEAMLNGDFFDPKKGYFGCPTTTGHKIGGVEFIRSKSAGNNEHISDVYNNAMTSVYYINPVNWMKSLTNGEMFAWMADNKLISISKKFALEDGEMAMLRDEKFVLALTKFVKDGELPEELAKYRALIEKFVQLDDLKSLKQFSAIMKTAKFFNTPTRLINNVSKFLQERLEGGRQMVVNMLSKLKMFQGEAVEKLLGNWVKGGGGKILVEGIKQGIYALFKVTAATVAPVVGWILGIVISFALEKAGKLALKVLIFAIFGIAGFVLLISAPKSTRRNMNKFDSYSLEVPGSIYYNDEFTGFGHDEDDVYIPGDGEIPPMSDQECILSAPSAHCTQGYKDVPEGYTHNTLAMYKPIDLSFVGYIYPPAFCSDPQNECIVTMARETYTDEYKDRWCDGKNAGGEMYLDGTYIDSSGQSNTFRLGLYHVQPLTPLVEPGQSGYLIAPPEGARTPIARISTAADGISSNPCWKGAHLHYTAKVNGAYVDPLELLNSWGCSLPSEEQCDI